MLTEKDKENEWNRFFEKGISYSPSEQSLQGYDDGTSSSENNPLNGKDNDYGCTGKDRTPSSVNPINNTIYVPPQSSLVIVDRDRFLDELIGLVSGFMFEWAHANCTDFLERMIKDGIIIEPYESNNYQFNGSRIDASFGNDSDDGKKSENSLTHNESTNSPASIIVPSQGIESNATPNDTVVSDHQYDSSSSESEDSTSDESSDCPKKSSKSRFDWYNRLKACAPDIYLDGYSIAETCKDYCKKNNCDITEQKMSNKFYNMNSDGFKEHLNGLRENCPEEDPSYLLDLVLCAHVRHDYSFDQRRSDDPVWDKWINRIRRRKSRKQKKEREERKRRKM